MVKMLFVSSGRSDTSRHSIWHKHNSLYKSTFQQSLPPLSSPSNMLYESQSPLSKRKGSFGPSASFAPSVFSILISLNICLPILLAPRLSSLLYSDLSGHAFLPVSSPIPPIPAKPLNWNVLQQEHQWFDFKIVTVVAALPQWLCGYQDALFHPNHWSHNSLWLAK